jgi:glycosyltransferase involved in cell wall biosynthesis
MRILVVSDAWHPQKNGVVVTMTAILENIHNHEICVVHPGDSEAKPAFPIYQDVTLVINPFAVVAKNLKAFRHDRIHIVTEGPLGFAARWICLQRGFPFTSSYHTQLPEYGWHLYRIPPGITRNYLAWFHAPSRRVLVPTASLARQLGYANAVMWGRGVDLDCFYPDRDGAPHPATLLYVGRVSKEKNVEAFCSLTGYRRIVVGDGPHLANLRQHFPDVEFAGFVPHEELRGWYNQADVFVFPSKTDTFGLVMLEAMACGLPVVGFDVTGPKDIVRQGITGFVGDNLADNVSRALAERDRLGRNALAYAREQSWGHIADRFLHYVCDLNQNERCRRGAISAA